jgi:hypothetical protein
VAIAGITAGLFLDVQSAIIEDSGIEIRKGLKYRESFNC